MLHFQRWKLILVFGVVIAGILFALPNLFPAATMARMPAWLPHKQVNLGLDLQGGAHLLYQLDEKEMIGDWLTTIRGDVRETLRSARVGYTDLSQNVATRQVTVKIRDAADMDKAVPGTAQARAAGRWQRVLWLLRLRPGRRPPG